MRAVVQVVTRAEVLVDGETKGCIARGLLVYLGVDRDDDEAVADATAERVVALRIFPDDDGRMNRSVTDVHGSVLVVSQFTLFGDVRRGRRPGFDRAAPPDRAKQLYERFAQQLVALGTPTATGVFRAHMLVRAEIDGPVTILVDSARTF